MTSKEGWFKEGWSRGAAVAAGLSLLAASPASAQSCAELTEQFAADHGLTAAPPPTVPPRVGGAAPDREGTAGSTGDPAIEGGSGSVTSRDLSQSGGVIAPPADGDQAVIDPGSSGASNMPTAPPIRPDAGAGTSGATGGPMDRAARDAQLESLITAARSAAESGDEVQCMNNLDRAQDLAQRTPSGAGGG
jgi:hypothetical protein